MTDKDARINCIEDFCNFVNNFSGELIIKGNSAYFNNVLVYKLFL